MGITYASNSSREHSRDFVLKYLREQKKMNPSLTVLDVGGSANSWADEVVTAYIDVVKANSPKPTFVGDINDSIVWESIQKTYGKADFILCTHTLEDIRDPIYVMQMIMASAKGGYISTPNKYAELSHVESHFFTGWSHHRWIFGMIPDGDDWIVRLIPKYAAVNYYSSYNYHPWVWLKRLLHLTNKDSVRPSRALPAVVKNKKIANLKHELGFVWQGSFKYEYTDYFPSTDHFLKDVRQFTEIGL